MFNALTEDDASLTELNPAPPAAISIEHAEAMIDALSARVQQGRTRASRRGRIRQGEYYEITTIRKAPTTS